jgi:hypothetical protein
MGAALGTMDKALTAPQIGETRSKLVGEAAQKRFDRMMKLFQLAERHAMHSLITVLPQRYFPGESLGGTPQVLFLLMLGVCSHKDSSALNSLALSYETQLISVAKKLQKPTEELTLVDLGEAIVNGNFQPEEF